MAKYIGPTCRLCRREATKLFLKGTKCSTDKCPFNRRAYSPGQHGKTRPKLSDYGVQLREKQKVKRLYGLLERQFRLYFLRAEKARGVTGHTLLQLLERRLDNVVFRLCLASSRAQARQMVRHGHIYVNDRRINIPSYLVKEADTIQVKAGQKFLKTVKDTVELVKERGVPVWITADHENLKGTVNRLPQREDIKFPVKEQLIVELYSK